MEGLARMPDCDSEFESPAVDGSFSSDVDTAIVEWRPTQHTQFLTSLYRSSMSETVVFEGAGPRELVFKQGGTGTGAVQWGSGRLLAHFLAREPQLQPLHELGASLPSAGGTGGGAAQAVVPAGWTWTGQRVVELGAGLGLAATVIAMCGADIVTTDGEQDLIDQLQSNVDANLGRHLEAGDVDCAIGTPIASGDGARIDTTKAGGAVAMLLPWGDEKRTAAVQRRVQEFAVAGGSGGSASGAPSTVLVVADCVFGSDRRVHKHLLRTINCLGDTSSCKGEGSEYGAGPLLLLTHKPRYPTERWFFKRLCKDW